MPTHSPQAVIQRYAALVVPRFRLQALCVAGGESVGECAGAVGVVDGDSKRGVLLEVSAEAEACGITPGMASTQALGRCAHLDLRVASKRAERQVLEKLLFFAESVSPRVEKRAEDRWLFDLRGFRAMGAVGGIISWERWGGEVLRRLLEEVRVQGRLGIAPGVGFAWCAAFRANPVRVVESPEVLMEELRFGELGVSLDLQQRLRDWGVSTLGDLLRLPRQATIERLGEEAAALWELARDSRESVLRLETFPEPLESAVEFDQPLEQVEPVLFALGRMLEELCSRMRLLQRVASAMHLSLQLEDGSTHVRHFTLPSPTREEAVWLRILDSHLETLHFEFRLTGASLRMEAVHPSSQQLALFENPLRDPNRFGETVARLRALVGEERVGVPVRGASHRPDTFVLQDPLEAFSQCAASPGGGAGVMAQTVLLGLPLRRFRPPLEVEVGWEQHRPRALLSGEIRGPVLESRGPYRASGDWWEGAGWVREEWDICLGGGQGGLYRLGGLMGAGGGGSWFLEGCYDRGGWPLEQRGQRGQRIGGGQDGIR